MFWKGDRKGKGEGTQPYIYDPLYSEKDTFPTVHFSKFLCLPLLTKTAGQSVREGVIEEGKPLLEKQERWELEKEVKWSNL